MEWSIEVGLLNHLIRYKLDSLFSQKQQDRGDRGHEEDQAGFSGRGGPQHRHQGDLPPQGAPAPQHRVSQG